MVRDVGRSSLRPTMRPSYLRASSISQARSTTLSMPSRRSFSSLPRRTTRRQRPQNVALPALSNALPRPPTPSHLLRTRLERLSSAIPPSSSLLVSPHPSSSLLIFRHPSPSLPIPPYPSPSLPISSHPPSSLPIPPHPLPALTDPRQIPSRSRTRPTRAMALPLISSSFPSGTSRPSS